MIGADPRFMLVDDDPDFHEIFADFLALALPGGEYELTCLDDPEAAVEALRDRYYTTVFVDYRLGATTGIEFIRNCQLDGSHAPFILMTGYESRAAEDEALAIGAFDFLSKDEIRPTLLARCIRHAVNFEARQEELRAALRQTQIAMAAQERFLGNMSHEMRTPLNGIIGFADVMLYRNDGINDVTRTYAQHIRDSGQRLLELVDGLLCLAQTSNAEALNPRLIYLHAFFGSLCLRFSTIAEARNIAFDLRLSEDLGRTLIDPEVLGLAVRPVIDNAVKFCEAGDQVQITVSRTRENLIIAVADTGSGMSPDILRQATQPFYQMDSGLTRSHEGAGIGLAVAQSSIASLRGDMSIESTPDGGTMVRIILPLADQKAEDADPDDHASPPPSGDDQNQRHLHLMG